MYLYRLLDRKEENILNYYDKFTPNASLINSEYTTFAKDKTATLDKYFFFFLEDVLDLKKSYNTSHKIIRLDVPKSELLKYVGIGMYNYSNYVIKFEACVPLEILNKYFSTLKTYDIDNMTKEEKMKMKKEFKKDILFRNNPNIIKNFITTQGIVLGHDDSKNLDSKMIILDCGHKVYDFDYNSHLLDIFDGYENVDKATETLSFH